MKHRCREISSLVLQSQDRPLRWHERLKVRVHLGMCTACSRFAAQLRFMGQAMQAWRAKQSALSEADNSTPD